MRVSGGLTCIAFGMLLVLAACGGGGDGMKTGAEAEGEPTPEGGDGITEPGGDGSGTTDDDIDTGDTKPGGDSTGSTDDDIDTGGTEPTDPTAAQLSIVGEYQRVPVGDAAGTVTAEFHRWGLWGGIPREDAVTCAAIGCPPPGDTIFLASLNHDVDGTVALTVNGTPSGTSPQAGSAVWTGEVLGYASADVAVAEGASVTAYEAVWGAARLEAEFETDTVDVDFTLLGEGRPDLSWDGLAMEAGAFGTADKSIEGSFYGADHEGAAGRFAHGGLAGVFGMLRSSTLEPGDGDTSGPDEPSWPVEPGEPGTGATDGVSIAWGPRLAGSGLSALTGGNDAFGPAAAAGLGAAARSAPAAAVNGVSQLSLPGQAVDAMRVRVARDDDGNLVYELTDGGQIVVRVPSPLPRLGFSVAVFTDLLPGIEPDLSSYPHDLLGMWAWGGAAGAFWSRSPEIPGVRSTGISPAGTATYEGDAAGLHAAGGSAAKFLADVEMVADFDSGTVGGTVDGFQTLSGKSLGDLSVTLGEAGFTRPGDGSGGTASIDMAGETASAGTAGSGEWGALWSDDDGWTMGGTFGFAADDASVSVLGAFTACSCASVGGGNPDDPVSTGP